MALEAFAIAVLLVTVGLSSAAEGDQCQVGSDCERRECCLRGVCRPMGGVADRCFTGQPYAWTRPEEMVVDFDRCPCYTGLFCGPITTGSQDGICTFGK